VVRTLFFDYLLTLSKRPDSWAQTQEKVLKKQLADQHAKTTRLKDELARLVKIARTSDRPPKALLDEMEELEKQQLVALESIGCSEKRMDASLTSESGRHRNNDCGCLGSQAQEGF